MNDSIGRVYRTNPKYKDSLFCLIFGSEKYKCNAIDLFNAINGSHFDNADDFNIITLHDAIYIKHKNDVSYLVDGRLTLFEHQSTVNPNMPLRGLNYFSELYSNYVRSNQLNVYGRTRITIPTPQYIVFYNGIDYFPAVETLKLSDMFTDNSVSDNFEWTATVINLNDPSNSSLLANCKPLSDYSIFIEKVRKYRYDIGVSNAIDRAVDECIKSNVLANLLSEMKSEVRDMLIYEFDEKVYEKGIREEGRTEGEMLFLIDIIIRHITNGVSIEDIARWLDRSIEEIKPIYDTVIANPKMDKYGIYQLLYVKSIV